MIFVSHYLTYVTHHNSSNNMGLEYNSQHFPHHLFSMPCLGLFISWFLHVHTCPSELPMRKLEGCIGVCMITTTGDVCHSHPYLARISLMALACLHELAPPQTALMLTKYCLILFLPYVEQVQGFAQRIKPNILPSHEV